MPEPSPSPEKVVFLHGWCGHGDEVESVRSAFPGPVLTVNWMPAAGSFDLEQWPSPGDRGPEEAASAMRAFADDVLERVRRTIVDAGFESSTIVGHSMGGAMASVLAADPALAVRRVKKEDLKRIAKAEETARAAAAANLSAAAPAAAAGAKEGAGSSSSSSTAAAGREGAVVPRGAAAAASGLSPAAAADLNSWNKKLDKLGLPPLDKIPGGFAPVLSSVNQEQSLFVEFLRPDGWLVVKPSVNTNGEDGTVSAGDYGKGDSAALYVSDLRPATDKAYYAKLLKGGIAQKGGGELYQEFKVRKVTPGAPTTVDFSYELLTGAGFIVERRGVAAVTDVNGKSQALLAVTTSARFKGLEPKLRTIADSFRCYEKVGSVPTDTFGLED